MLEWFISLFYFVGVNVIFPVTLELIVTRYCLNNTFAAMCLIQVAFI